MYLPITIYIQMTYEATGREFLIGSVAGLILLIGKVLIPLAVSQGLAAPV